MGERIRTAWADFNGDCWTGLPRQACAGARIPTSTWPGDETWLSARLNRHNGHGWCKSQWLHAPLDRLATLWAT